ncbi:hypothetical protein [Coxiella endosymbiont of Dermacentor marginatus]|uniref:hypothetical protein n=1 Tax=Coxiella endosymbiont of Dermacentor marginatus TaxID=1656159 RepID=UPI0022228F98|nr:hypothetical protein [Coxiella endosymbiont of Dermacentor marginatus]
MRFSVYLNILRAKTRLSETFVHTAYITADDRSIILSYIMFIHSGYFLARNHFRLSTKGLPKD